MVPGRLLHRLASQLAGRVTVEQIVEPLIADFQHEFGTARGRRQRVAILIRGYFACTQTIAWCGLRALASAPARATTDQAIVWLYSTAIMVVLLFGVDWVRTGDVSARMAVHRLGQLTVLAPWIIWTRFGVPGRRADRRPLSAAATIGLLGVVAVVAAVACWLNPIATRAIVTTNAAYVILSIALRHVSWLKA